MEALYSHAQGFFFVGFDVPLITTFKAGYFRIFTISDRDIVSEPMTKSNMVPAIKTKFPVSKIFDNLS
ncbi:MAG: hypothetical protein KKG35_02965 [Proteobacteria bacterium]|nr:hypothetical protein [Pseudomonadota bacterium]